MEEELQHAISLQQNIQIIYLGSQGKATLRKLRPLGIIGGRLKAYCLTRRAPRIFVIENILSIQSGVVRRAI